MNCKKMIMDTDTTEIFYKTMHKYHKDVCIGQTEGKAMPLIVVTDSDRVSFIIQTFTPAMGAEIIESIPAWEPYTLSFNEDLWPSW